MAVTADELLDELKQLRRGWGVLGDLQTRLGSRLAELADIKARDDDQHRRDKLTTFLTQVAARLPEEVATTALVGLCLRPEARLRHLEAREDWLRQRSGDSPRTVKRRLDEALGMLAHELVRIAAQPKSKPDADTGWHVSSFSALVRLDTVPIEVVEERTMVAEVDGVWLLGTSVGVPRHPKDDAVGHGLDAELLYGGRLALQEHPSESRFRHVIELPHALAAGEQHRYSLRLRVPPGQPMAPHYVHTPKRHTEHFELRIRFQLDSLPQKVWKLDKVPTTVIYEREPAAELLVPDRFGEVYAEFHNLKIGYGYGISWSE